MASCFYEPVAGGNRSHVATASRARRGHARSPCGFCLVPLARARDQRSPARDGAHTCADLRTTAPILFIANVGEEGEGDLRGMRQVFNNAVLRDSIASVLVIDGAGTDTLVTQALGSRRFEVTMNGPGGHSWSDFGTPNPIVVLARAIDALSRTEIPANPKTTYNVGVISGGTSVNSIPESATIRVDIRSSSSEEIEKVEQSLRRAVADAVQQANAAAPQRNGSPLISAEVKMIG